MMEKSKQKPSYREGTPQIESVSTKFRLLKFTPEQFLEPPVPTEGNKEVEDTGHEPLFVKVRVLL
ncbi:hypothetical protein EI981_21055 [Paenibacillus lutimineralis]|uniref:Uncharacterized protein n=1 Tax=Paenibacillus lutimineralis TaxID=2707005 RepID=A0A3Q9IB33_9BACL|nr:hypothetical protein EI981_21055 [Paenibacillus lutimineralis]